MLVEGGQHAWRSLTPMTCASRVATAISEGESCRCDRRTFRYRAFHGREVVASACADTGSPAPAKFGGHRTCSLDPHRAFVLEQIEEVPHLTLHRLKDLLAQRGIAVSHDTVWRFLRREGRSFKKNALRGRAAAP